MKVLKRLGIISTELKHHAPFTLFGALTGIACMLLFKNIGHDGTHRLFQIFHPTHVVLSAMVTASLFRLYEKGRSFLIVLIVGYAGSIGVATLSDCVLPFFGETILGVAVPLHHDSHEPDTHAGRIEANGDENHLAAEHTESDDRHGPRIHLGFIEDWYFVNPAAMLGVLIAYFLPRSRIPHAGHVIISTWASSFHVLMNTQRELTGLILIGVFAVLFIAVWLPCCVSDIVFPMLLVKPGEKPVHHHH